MLPRPPLAMSRFACFRVRREVVPFFGGGSLTPARRALDKPIAMACLAERAPCFPSRMCSISSRTNSPAWVEGDLPSRASSRARSIVSCSGISTKSFAAKFQIGRMKLPCDDWASLHPNGRRKNQRRSDRLRSGGGRIRSAHLRRTAAQAARSPTPGQVCRQCRGWFGL